MLENALYGSRKYWGWVFGLLAVMAVGAVCYIWQYNEGLGITGLSRDVSWGFYIAQFTFLVGVAASAVMVVLPYYLHNYKAFAKITILGEFLAISSVSMCVMFIFVDMGQPFRIVNMFIHPSPKSMMLCDTVALLLVHRHSRPAVPRVGVRFRSGAADHRLSAAQAVHQI